MKLYPSDNLPVIITQLQAYFIERAKKTMRKYYNESEIDNLTTNNAYSIIK